MSLHDDQLLPPDGEWKNNSQPTEKENYKYILCMWQESEEVVVGSLIVRVGGRRREEELYSYFFCSERTATSRKNDLVGVMPVLIYGR